MPCLAQVPSDAAAEELRGLQLLESSQLEEARAPLEFAARAGRARAQFALAQLLENASDRAPDPNAQLQQALDWYQRAAAQDLPDAVNNLGAMYYDGRIVPRDVDEAAKLYRRAATLGSAAGRYNLGLLIVQGRAEGTSNEGVDLIREAATQGLANAQAQLGRMYFDGRLVRVNHQEAAHWFALAAAQGQAWSQYFYADMLRSGDGTGRDLTAAVQWMTRAADQDVPPAIYELGLMLDLGLGVPSDPARARALWKRAAELGVDDAARRLESDHVGVPGGKP